ncbi:unnamed protein product [Diamesa serratosioi]
MDKSSLKSFRNLLNQNKNYKISPNGNFHEQHSATVKLNGLNSVAGTGDDITNIEDIYAIKTNKFDENQQQQQQQQQQQRNANGNIDDKTLIEIVSANVRRYLNLYNCRSSFCLLSTIVPVACSVSVVIIIAAIAGPQWIQIVERIPSLSGNSTYYRSNYTLSYTTKSSNASLWIICTRQEDLKKNCTTIDYFSTEKYQPDPTDSNNESTNVIPYTITLSSPLLIISFIILLISYLLFLLAICSSQKDNKYQIYFVSGIGFIIAGLLMLSGLIMFISIFKSEIHHKLRRSSTLEAPLFSFKYGTSFLLYVIGFICTEFSGIGLISLFNRLQKIAHFNQQNLFQLNNYVKIGSVDVPLPNNTCRRHLPVSFVGYKAAGPTSRTENGYLPQNTNQNRRCSVHSNNLTKSLGEMFNNLPAMSQQHHHQHHQQHQRPQFEEFNHTRYNHQQQNQFRTVSTSTDLDVEIEGDTESTNNQRKIPIIKMINDKTNVGSNNNNNNNSNINNSNNNTGKIDFNNMCGMIKTTTTKSKENIVKEQQCQNNVNNNYNRTPSKMKSKNIYYIEDTSKDDDHNIFIIDPQTLHKHKRMRQQSMHSMEDMHKLTNMQLNGHGYYNNSNNTNNNHNGSDIIGWNIIDRNACGSRTLPRDFMMRRNMRPSLDNLLDNYYHQQQQDQHRPNGNIGTMDDQMNLPYKRSYQNINSMYNQQPQQYIHNSFDELNSSKLNNSFYFPPATRNYFDVSQSPQPPSQQQPQQLEYQWPKVIPKSPSSFSAHSFRLNRQPQMRQQPHNFAPTCLNYNVIDEFDLDKIEYERRKSHTNLFDSSVKENVEIKGTLKVPVNDYVKKKSIIDFGTAV